MANTYIPLTIKVTGTTASVGQYFDDGIPRFFVYFSLVTSASGAQTVLRQMTTLPYCVQCHYGNNQVYLVYTGATSALQNLYYSTAIVFPYFMYQPTGGASFTGCSGTITVYATPVTTINGGGRLVGKDVLSFFDENFDIPKNLYASATTIVTGSGNKPYATYDDAQDNTYLLDFASGGDNDYTPLNGLQWIANNNYFVYSIPTYSVYWTGSTITAVNQSVNSALSLTSFSLIATTTANTNATIFQTTSTTSIPAAETRTISVSHPAGNPIAAVSALTLTANAGGPATWNGPVKVVDSKGVFDHSSSTKALSVVKEITSNTSGGTVTVYLRPATRSGTASTGLQLRAYNYTSKPIVLMYFDLYCRDVNGSNPGTTHEIFTITGNPTIASGGNVVLGKNIYLTSFSATHLKVDIDGYCANPTGPMTITVSGSTTSQYFGTHSISGVDPASFSEDIEWDAGGNVTLTGGTITVIFQ